MRRFILVFFLAAFFAAALHTEAATGRVMKVLPHFLDQKGRHTISPSLYERDAYQAFLRQHPQKRGGIRIDVEFKKRGRSYSPVTLRVELVGIAKGNTPHRVLLETPVQTTGAFGRWISLPVSAEDFEKLGQVTAWRATLWEENQILSEQKSLLW